MIVSVDEIKSLDEFADMSEPDLQMMLESMETLVRKYTNNNFQVRSVRFRASSVGNVLNGVHPFLKVGDTIQISETDVNDGLYVITEIGPDTTTVDKDLWSVDHNLVTKVQYPYDIRMGIINLMKWEKNNRGKVGIKSETISRHSVTYFDQDANNQVMGYPVSLLGFLELYKKARF